MPNKEKNFYVTTPIYYVNDVPHLGHAYTTIAADILARYHRMMLGAGNVWFLTGTDEHGTKVAQAAEKHNMTPQKWVDTKAAEFQMIWDRLDISYNDFIRTTDKRHVKLVTEFLKQLKDAKTPLGNPAIYAADYEGLYCVGCECFKTEEELINGKCPDHNTEPIKMKEKNWFLRLSDYNEKLKELLEKSEGFDVLPVKRRNEILGLIKTGLKDVSISREHLKWGIPLPFDKDQVAYVWIDALTNYITALGGPKNKKYKKFWPADIHLMAKDILKFHATIWPALLLALKLPLPKMVFAHGFFTINGQKMSKTIGNVIAPDDLVSKFGSDATRYLLFSQFGFGTDGDIIKDRLPEIYNSALANELGNLVSRVLSMTEKYHKGVVPAYDVKYDKFFEFDLKTDWDRYDFFMKNLKFEEALNVVWEHVRRCNAYVDKEKPWELAKIEPKVLANVMYNLLESLRQTAIMLWPFMPQTSENIIKQLGLSPIKEFKKPIDKLRKWAGLPLGHKIKKGESLFPRLEK